MTTTSGHRISCQLYRRILAALVLLLTAIAFAGIVIGGGHGIYEQCTVLEGDWTGFSVGAADGWSEEDYASWRRVMLPLFATTTCFAAAVSARLLAHSGTKHLARVAEYTSLLWMACWSLTVSDALMCRGSLLTVAFLLTALAGLCEALAMLTFLAVQYERLCALEATAFQSMGTVRLKRSLQLFGLVAVIGVAGLGPQAVQSEVGSHWRTAFGLAVWLIIFAFSCITLLVTMPIFQVLTLVREASRLQFKQGNEEIPKALRTLQVQLFGVLTCLLSSNTAWVLMFWSFDLLWPAPVRPPSSPEMRGMLTGFTHLLDNLCNLVASLALSGVCTGALEGSLERCRSEEARYRGWTTSSLQWAPCPHLDWQSKVEELAQRGVTLDALMQFYRGLGTVAMPHFDPLRHTTEDVVYAAIIPLSSASGSSMAEVMMAGVKVLPRRMVTHNWSNRFSHLLASIIADAMDEREYGKIAYMLIHDVEVLQEWLQKSGIGKQTYWVCAVSVNQHLGICSRTQDRRHDTVTNELHPVCSCGLPKAFNDTPPLANGRSIVCEMNKFDCVMRYISRSDPDFSQVVAVDNEFDLFSRAWCIAEIAAACEMGMPQKLKFSTRRDLEKNQDRLRSLKIAEMNASRIEDKQEILSRISDHEAFDQQIQVLLFDRLLPSWNSLDAFDRMLHVGRIAWWQKISRRNSSSMIWTACDTPKTGEVLSRTV